MINNKTYGIYTSATASLVKGFLHPESPKEQQSCANIFSLEVGEYKDRTGIIDKKFYSFVLNSQRQNSCDASF